MKDWIKELCPEIDDWQAELIAEQCQQCIDAEREECAKVAEKNGADEPYGHAKFRCHNIAEEIRARGER